MISLALAAGLATVRLLCQAGVESFPVQHQEPITVRVLNGTTGKPVSRLRLRLVAGYDEGDIVQQMWRGEAATNAAGDAQVPVALANFPFLQVRAAKARLCQSRSHGETYNVARIRNAGWSASNTCGFLPVAETPRVLIVFVKRHGAGPGPENGDGGQPPPQPAIVAQEQGVDFAAGEDLRGPTELEALTASSENEIDVLVKRSAPHSMAPNPVPDPVPDPHGPGTGGSDDAYDLMCQPGT